MKLLWNGKEVASVETNRSMNIEEAICLVYGIDNLTDQKELELLSETQEFVCFEDCYFVPVEEFEIEY